MSADSNSTDSCDSQVDRPECLIPIQLSAMLMGWVTRPKNDQPAGLLIPTHVPVFE